MNTQFRDLSQIKQLLNKQAIDAERKRRRCAFLTMFPDTGPLRREVYPKHLEFFHAGSLPRDSSSGG
jgi:hypothetical protein